MKRCLSIVVLALLSLAQPTFAQTGTVSSSVLDRQTGDPLVGAIVFLEGTQIGITCDIEGRFQLFDVPVGTYVLASSMIGYQDASIIGVEVQDGEVAKLTITLAPEDGTPYATPVIYNATYIGSGAFSTNGDNDVVLKIRDNAGGKYHNSIFTDFAGEGVNIEDLESGEDSRARLEAGDLVLANNIWWGFGAASLAPEFALAHLVANNNRLEDPLLMGISRARDGGLDPRLQDSSPAWNGSGAIPDDGFYTQVTYVGAFGDELWTSGWTFLAEAGIMPNEMATVIASESEVSAAIPNAYTLNQNYPNPFNPSTTIAFAIPADGHVELILFNTLGQQVATLSEGWRMAGTYSVAVDASDLSAGTYFYRLRAGDQVLHRKMTLLK